MANMFLSRLQGAVARYRYQGLIRCDDWAEKIVEELSPDSLLDVGCGDGNRLISCLSKVPRELYGVEGAPLLQAAAAARGIKVLSYDLNGRWPFDEGKFDVVYSNQVIEHLHNTRLFAMEAFRVLKPGGTAVITSENLCSLLNCLALFMGYTPFSLMQTCGRYLGNPLGLHYNEPLAEPLPMDHPAFSGVSGHVRVLTVRQARELFELVGFEVEVRSVAILPLPDRLSRMLERIITNRGHYLMIRARKALATDAISR
jgi:SAM-dependent methyltransferase